MRCERSPPPRQAVEIGRFDLTVAICPDCPLRLIVGVKKHDVGTRARIRLSGFILARGETCRRDQHMEEAHTERAAEDWLKLSACHRAEPFAREKNWVGPKPWRFGESRSMIHGC